VLYQEAQRIMAKVTGAKKGRKSLRSTDLTATVEPAVEALQSAAGQGHVLAQFELGFVYMQGAGVPRQNNSIAKRWLRRAAEQGHVQAQLELGCLFATDDPNSMDTSKWLSRTEDSLRDATSKVEWGCAAAQFHAEGKSELSRRRYYRGLGHACDFGLTAVTQSILGLGNQGGELLAEDKDTNIVLLLAAQKGHASVVELLLAAKGVDVNRAQSDGATALLIAA
jgi:TPR repeat protein